MRQKKRTLNDKILMAHKKREAERLGIDVYEIETLQWGEFVDISHHFSIDDVLSQLCTIKEMVSYQVVAVRKNGKLLSISDAFNPFR